MYWQNASEDRFRRAKFVDFFRCLDRDGNGVLEKVDFDLVVERLKAYAPDASADWDAVLTAWHGLWTHIQELMDVNRDDVITEQEFIGFYARAAQTSFDEADVPEWALKHIDATLKAMDLDGDGQISQAEYQAYLHAIGSEADPAPAFARLDTNGDGQIDMSELSAQFGEWLTAGRAGGAGNLLVTGRLPDPMLRPKSDIGLRTPLPF